MTIGVRHILAVVFAFQLQRWITLLLAAAFGLSNVAAEDRVLVYTRNFTPNGKGYIHDNISTSAEAIKKMGQASGFAVTVSDEPSIFTDELLKPYSAIVFSNSNNEAFSNDRQREAFRAFIARGKGFVGIHSASGSERQWPLYWAVLGGKFAFHPKMQTFTVRVADRNFPGAKELPETFEWTDECYFHTNLSPALHPVLTTDRTQLKLDKTPIEPATFPNPLPLCWYQQVEGGREFYLALGHKKEAYTDPILTNLIKNGILWAMKKNVGT